MSNNATSIILAIIAAITTLSTLATPIILYFINKKQNAKISAVNTIVSDVKEKVVEQNTKVDKVVEVVEAVKVEVVDQKLKAEKIVGAVDGYHKEVNGKMEKLLEKTEALAKLEQKVQNGKT